MNDFRNGLICIIILVLLNQLSLTMGVNRIHNQVQKLQDSTNLIINRTDTILTILQD